MNMADWWQYLPEHIDPVALTIGSLSVRWYAICFLVGFFATIGHLLVRSRKERHQGFDPGMVWDSAVLTFVGVLVGGRLGYALVYDPSLFLTPFSLILPLDPGTGAYSGIHGMSFFGALLGGGIMFFLHIRSRSLDFFTFADHVAPSIPIALFIGRIGNFLNLELPGRTTSLPWGMYFPGPATGIWELRHPSQLYEALLEGIVLFFVMVIFRKRNLPKGTMVVVFLGGYAVVRFLVEFFREPDPGSPIFFGWMTVGQVLALLLFVISIFVLTRTDTQATQVRGS